MMELGKQVCVLLLYYQMNLAFNLTFQNHFKFGYDGHWYVPRANPRQRYTTAFGTCSTVTDWHEECLTAARLIRDDTDLPIHVLYSGGIDSEVALLSFLDAGIPITADIMRFKDDLNGHDIQYALEFCRSRSVPHVIHDLDIVAFFENDMHAYAAATRCVSPQLCATMWLIDQIDGYPIIGQGECVVARDGERWVFRESEKINAWYRFFMIRDRPGAPGFHQYTPGQMLSFLLDDTFTPFMTPDSGKNSNKTTKYRIYSRYFPLRYREKYTGFENVSDHDQRYRAKLLDSYSEYDDQCSFEISSFIDSLRSGMIL
jgi:hypothetical protein